MGLTPPCQRKCGNEFDTPKEADSINILIADFVLHFLCLNLVLFFCLSALRMSISAFMIHVAKMNTSEGQNTEIFVSRSDTQSRVLEFFCIGL